MKAPYRRSASKRSTGPDRSAGNPHFPTFGRTSVSVTIAKTQGNCPSNLGAAASFPRSSERTPSLGWARCSNVGASERRVSRSRCRDIPKRLPAMTRNDTTTTSSTLRKEFLLVALSSVISHPSAPGFLSLAARGLARRSILNLCCTPRKEFAIRICREFRLLRSP